MIWVCTSRKGGRIEEVEEIHNKDNRFALCWSLCLWRKLVSCVWDTVKVESDPVQLYSAQNIFLSVQSTLVESSSGDGGFWRVGSRSTSRGSRNSRGKSSRRRRRNYRGRWSGLTLWSGSRTWSCTRRRWSCSWSWRWCVGGVMVGQGAGRGAAVETVSSGISARWAQQWGRLRRSADVPLTDRALISSYIWWHNIEPRF